MLNYIKPLYLSTEVLELITRSNNYLLFESRMKTSVFFVIFPLNLADMKQSLSFILLVISFLSCKQQSQADKIVQSYKLDQMVDSAIKKDLTNLAIDTSGLYKSPVKILKVKFFKGEYSSEIQLTYKNVSSKDIAAIRFKWYGLNAFGEPAAMGGSSTIDGLGGGFADNTLKAGKSTESIWTVYSRDGKKIIQAWPYEVAFEDGTKWQLKP
jgi:hypothetical protein